MKPGVNCTQPPQMPPAGTWEWNGSYKYGTRIKYSCGPYGKFELEGGKLTNEIYSECSWNKSWTPAVLPTCVATACPDIPFPPKEIGMVYAPDNKNNMTLVSGTMFNLDLIIYFYPKSIFRIYRLQPNFAKVCKISTECSWEKSTVG